MKSKEEVYMKAAIFLVVFTRLTQAAHLLSSKRDSPVMKPVAEPLNLSATASIPGSGALNQDTLTWVGLGDYFTAAPGTGLVYPPDENCLRGAGSYAWQLNRHFPFSKRSQLFFEACSPFTTIGVIDYIIPVLPQIPDPDFMLMTLGQLDVGIPSIMRYCLFSPADRYPTECRLCIAQFWEILRSDRLEKSMHKIYDGIFATMKNDRQHQLYHIFYPTFFGTETTEESSSRRSTEWCEADQQTLVPGGPILSMEKRRYHNSLIVALNQYLQRSAVNYIRNVMPARGFHGKLITIDPNSFFNGAFQQDLFKWHRICNRDGEGHTQLLSDWDWFTVLSPNATTQTEATTAISKRAVEDTAEEGGIDNGTNVKYIPFANNSTNGTADDLPEWLTKTFSLKKEGFSQIAGALMAELRRKRPWDNGLGGNGTNSTGTPEFENVGNDTTW